METFSQGAITSRPSLNANILLGHFNVKMVASYILDVKTQYKKKKN